MSGNSRNGGMAGATQFVTHISRVAPGEISIRGYDVRDLIGHASASEGAFLTIVGRRPSRSELRLFDAILCSCLDHGLVNTLSVSARYVVSGSASLPAAMAAGLLCFGPYTGAAHLTAELLIEIAAAHGASPDDSQLDAVLGRRRSSGEPIPGLGHPIHRDFDPRAQAVLQVAGAVGLIGPSVELLERIRERASNLIGRRLVLNIDGLMAGLLHDIGLSPEQILATNIWAAMPGIAAHAIEEKRSGKRLRYPADHAASYTLPGTTLPWEDEQSPPARPGASPEK